MREIKYMYDEKMIKEVGLYLKKVSDGVVYEMLSRKENVRGEVIGKKEVVKEECDGMREELFREDSDFNSNIEEGFFELVVEEINRLYSEEFGLK